MEFNLQCFGGRGSTSRNSTVGISGGGGNGASANNTNSIADQVPDANNTPVTPGGVTALSQMDDDSLANLIKQSKNVDMPNHLADINDPTQKFVYQAGLNAKPMVLDKASFDQYLKDNNIPKSNILSRTVSDSPPISVNGVTYTLKAAQIQQMTRDSALNYIGGKHGGQVYGAGTYFDMNGGANTGYGSVRGKSVTIHGVLSPNAKVIDKGSLQSAAITWSRKNPKSAAAIGSINNKNLSIYALAMGYNVITDSKTRPSYHNIIDRSALVLDSSNY